MSAASPQPPRPPAQPTFRPGYAALPRPPEPQPPYGPPYPYGPSKEPSPHAPPPVGPPSYGPSSYGPSSYGPSPYGPSPYGPSPYGPSPYGPSPGAEYPPTTPFAAPPGDSQPGYGQPYPGDPAAYPPTGHGPVGHPPPGYGTPPPRRRSNVPLVALILAVGVLLCGGAVTAGVMAVNAMAERAKEAVKPITEPTPPQLPTEAPDLPGLPTALPTLPTDLPALPGTTGRTITVTYEVTGDGPVQIGYVEKSGEPKRIADVKLPWKVTTTMDSPTFLLVTAIRADTADGSVSCRVRVDGEEVAQSTRDGGFATVACSKWVLD